MEEEEMSESYKQEMSEFDKQLKIAGDNITRDLRHRRELAGINAVHNLFTSGTVVIGAVTLWFYPEVRTIIRIIVSIFLIRCAGNAFVYLRYEKKK
jgi:hypothetical protein